MNKAILTALAILLITATATAASATWTAAIDINGAAQDQSSLYLTTTEDGVLCMPDDGNVSITVADINANSGVIVLIDGTRTANVAVDQNGDTTVNDNASGTDVNISTATAADILNTNLKVTVPAAEGIHVICVADINSGWDDPNGETSTDYNRYYCETIGVKPDSTTKTNYTITNADGNGYCQTGSYSAFDGKIEDSTGYGRIETYGGNTFDFSADSINFDSSITWSNAKKVEVTTSSLIGQLAKVTFLKPNISSSRFEVRRNDSSCSICGNLTSADGKISFTTSSFSIYEVMDLPPGSTPSGGGAIGTFVPASIIPGGDIVGAIPGGLSTIVIGIIVLVIVAIAIKSKK